MFFRSSSIRYVRKEEMVFISFFPSLSLCTLLAARSLSLRFHPFTLLVSPTCVRPFAQSPNRCLRCALCWLALA